MQIIEIKALENGAHRNQTFDGVPPDGWAVLPGSLETENFPFGEVVVDEVNGVPTVVDWTPLPVPEPTDPHPVPESGTDASLWDELDKAFQEGVNSAYDQ